MNNKLNEIYNFDSKLLSLAEQAEKNCTESFRRINEIAEYNNAKVLKAVTSSSGKCHLITVTSCCRIDYPARILVIN